MRMRDALSVSDLVIGKTGNLQVGQFIQLGTPQLVAISLEPEQVGEVIEGGQICQVVLRNIHIAQVDVGTQQVDVCQTSRRWQRTWVRLRIQQKLAAVLKQRTAWRWLRVGRRMGDQWEG